MKRLYASIAAIVLGSAVVLGGSADAWAQWRGGWHGAGWRGGWGGMGWRGGWGGAGWRGGWAPGWRAGWGGVGWRGGGWGWNRGGWGWNRGWGWRNNWWPYATAAGLTGLGLGLAATSPYWGWDYGWPYDSYYGPSYGYGYGTSPVYFGAYQAPVVTGRSVAAGGVGMHCATQVKTCLLRNASYVGGGCSCRVAGGRARGTVTP